MSNIEIKIATLEDVEELGKMHYESSKKHMNTFNSDMPFSLADMMNITKNIINNPRAVLIKATIENTICGCLFLLIIESEEAKIWNNEDEHIGHISEIYVKEDYLKQRNIYGLDLEVYNFNNKARNLYQKQGFEEIKTYMHKTLK